MAETPMEMFHFSNSSQCCPRLSPARRENSCRSLGVSAVLLRQIVGCASFGAKVSDKVRANISFLTGTVREAREQCQPVL